VVKSSVSASSVVIPSRTPSVVHTEAGCDIPMYRASVVADGDDENGEAEACTVSLDADLPPLAIEHPARVWNVLIHSLPAELQPVIKWTWDTELTNGQGRKYPPLNSC
jgi:hypothetical protein